MNNLCSNILKVDQYHYILGDIMIQSDIPIPVPTLIRHIAHSLCCAYGDKNLCDQYAWWVLETITHKNKSTLIVENTITLSQIQMRTLTQWIKDQVEQNIPLQYLIGSVPFIDCEILVEPPILIPRSETEWWCNAIIEQLKTIKESLKILDLCTGSGCIAVALAKALPQATIVASDISPLALTLAQKNAQHNNVSIRFIQSDLFTNIDEQFDIIISNPPYVSPQEFKSLDLSVKNWEDTNALIAPENGLGIIKEIALQARNYLKPNTLLLAQKIPQFVLEIGHLQGEAVKEILSKQSYLNPQLHLDLHNKARLITTHI